MGETASRERSAYVSNLIAILRGCAKRAADRAPCIGGRFALAGRMDYDMDPTARVRERRFQGLVSDLLPRVRRLNPMMPDDQVLEMAESMAELRLLDEEIG